MADGKVCGRCMLPEDESGCGCTDRVDFYQTDANLYGCVPCPRCGSRYRWPTQDVHPTKPSMILCDDCGYEEGIRKREEENAS